jgi:hypothetical protein
MYKMLWKGQKMQARDQSWSNAQTRDIFFPVVAFLTAATMSSTDSSISQPDASPSSPVGSLVNPSLDSPLPSKSAAEFYGYGDCDSPYSLNKLMSNRKTTLKNLHSSFIHDLEMRRDLKSVAFDSIDYGYGEDAPGTEPPAKKRRFQRRNSKTPAMLMRMNSPLTNLDFLANLEMDEQGNPTQTGDDDDNWDGGLEIAEELVQQIRNRRCSSASSSS